MITIQPDPHLLRAALDAATSAWETLPNQEEDGSSTWAALRTKRHVLATLAGVQAAAGDSAAATATAGMIDHYFDRNLALQRIARVSAVHGDTPTALAAAGAVAGGQEKVRALADVIKTLAGVGDESGALEAAGAAGTIIESLEPVARVRELCRLSEACAAAGNRAGGLAAATIAWEGMDAISDTVFGSQEASLVLAEAFARLGNADEAMAVAEAGSHDHNRVRALATVAETLMEVGHPHGAYEAATRASHYARIAPRYASQGKKAARAAEALAKVGEAALARETLDEAREYVLRDLDDPGEDGVAVARAYASMGLAAEAMALARALPDDPNYWESGTPKAFHRDRAREGVAAKLAANGDAHNARAAAEELEDTDSRIPYLRKISRVLSDSGYPAAAAALATVATQAALDAAEEAGGRADVWCSAARLYADAGDTRAARLGCEAARAEVEQISERSERNEHLADLAASYAAAADAEAARKTAEKIDHADERAGALQRVAEELAFPSYIQAMTLPGNPDQHASQAEAVQRLIAREGDRASERVRQESKTAAATRATDVPPATTRRPTPPRSSQAAQTSTRSGNQGACFVATAVYGSYDCPEVRVLRRWRDEQLACCSWGRQGIRLYYRVSPTIARALERQSRFARLVRVPLDRLTCHLAAKGYSSAPYSDRQDQCTPSAGH